MRCVGSVKRWSAVAGRLAASCTCDDPGVSESRASPPERSQRGSGTFWLQQEQARIEWIGSGRGQSPSRCLAPKNRTQQVPHQRDKGHGNFQTMPESPVFFQPGSVPSNRSSVRVDFNTHCLRIPDRAPEDPRAWISQWIGQ